MVDNVTQSWGCPGCSFTATTPDTLAAHVRFIHVTPRFDEESAPSWKCSLPECRRSRRAFTGANGLAKHLDLHALSLRPRRRYAPREEVVGTPLVSPAFTWLMVVLLSVCAWAGGNPQPNPNKVDQKKVDEAIKKGAEWLKSNGSDFGDENAQTELTVYTLLHAGVPVNDSAMEAGIKYVKGVDVEKAPFGRHKTYRVALSAMVLETLSALANQDKIAQCAEFLVMNQCENGQWSYGDPIPLPKMLKTPDGGKVVAEGDKAGLVRNGGGKGGSQSLKKIPIDCPKRIGPETGDNSNTQYALLGLRSCAEAGCAIPDKTWMDAIKIEEQAQDGSGGWGYHLSGDGDHDRDRGKGKKGGGGGRKFGGGYGGMTCSGICDLVIARHYMHLDWRNDSHVQKGLKWLAENFTVEEAEYKRQLENSPFGDGGNMFFYYYLYAMERTGALADTEVFGAHDWYDAGAKYLLDQQKDDGSWEGDRRNNTIDNTCFAILFLRRATPPIIQRISK